MIERPKQGFAIPIESWLRTILADELRGIAQNRVFADRFSFDYRELGRIINGFLDRKRYVNPHFIWYIYSLYQWGKRW